MQTIAIPAGWVHPRLVPYLRGRNGC
jgi:hypothetical protein